MEHPSRNLCAGELKAGPWGGDGGSEWSYRFQDGITQITIVWKDRYIRSIDALIFQSQDGKTERFGGHSNVASTHQAFINIDFPKEFLTGISGSTYTPTFVDPTAVIQSLKFYTNRTEHGPFGWEYGNPIFFRPEGDGAMITGFFGRAHEYIDAIGVYYRSPMKVPLMEDNSMKVPLIEDNSMKVPLVEDNSMKVPLIEDNSMKVPLVEDNSTDMKLRNPGPWGGDYGRVFDDGAFSDIKQIHVYLCSSKGAISAIHFEYVNKKGEARWSPMHGDAGATAARKIEIDPANEFLIGIQGFYGSIEGSGGVVAITSLTFQTNKGKYGPLGREAGKFFSSVDRDSKVIGFFGKCGEYLNAIGKYAEYL